MSFPSIVNNQEFFSDHYLDAVIANDLKGLRGDWDAREQRHEVTPRRAVRALRETFDKLKQDAEDGASDRGLDALSALHDATLTALDYQPHRDTIEAARGDVVSVAIPIAHETTLPTGLRLLALEAGYATSSDEALGAEHRLIQPLVFDREEIREPTKAISLAFTTDDPPRHVLLLAGATLVLAARDSWSEGRYLAVDLDLALGRNDTKAKGELDTVAALFSRDALVPGEAGEAIIDELTTSSHKQAVGVSADLREGVRRSVEDIADEIIAQRLAKNLAVYNQPDIARSLTRESLRFLYRILFLLYAEARPELGIVPSLAEGYRDGYGVDRLRELALTELTTSHAREGIHLHASLDVLFELVNDGYHHEFAAQQLVDEGDTADDTGLIFEPLHSELFGPNATPLLDSIRLRNHVVQRILARLLLTREKSGRERRFVSYATLGINQLGAVYEGLMAYTGFLADEDLHEVRKPGSEEKHGTWVVPVTRADEYPDEVFVTETGEDGIARRVRHPKGSFVYRLSGRDRQRSASYYTPEVLTRCVVKHALEELLDQDGNTTSADELLELTICEPALGSGAFLNEAINQLSAEYLARRQNELEDTIDPDAYPGELQKVKTHFALHQSYGVDLNATAVELAEVSLWLNAMHPGLRAPWFGLHLRRGNSLIGARRAVYPQGQLAGRKWLKAVPEDRAFTTDPLGADEVHHFLLPADGWGAVKGAKEAKELRPDALQRLKDWHKAVTGSIPKADAARYAALARRVEALWELAAARIGLAERDLRRPLQLYGRPAATQFGGVATTRAAIEAALGDENTPLARLRLVMDSWCAMWFWPLEAADGITPPTTAEWLSALEGLLGIDPADTRDTEPAQIDLFADLDALEAREAELAAGLLMPSVTQVGEQHPWLAFVREVADREGFFHWELQFAPVFQGGGFDLQVGNPPWVRLDWQDAPSLSEISAWFGVSTESDDKAQWASRRRGALDDTVEGSRFLSERTAAAGLSEALSSSVNWPLLSGYRTNLYGVFVCLVERLRNESGVSALIHQEGHLTDNRARKFRARCLKSLRRHWQFVNELKLFEDVGHTREFGIHVYGAQRENVSFQQIASVFDPATVDGSLLHDGTGPVPSALLPQGGWDLRPHRDRVLTVDDDFLTVCAGLVEDAGNDPGETRLLRPLTIGELYVLTHLSRAPTKLGNLRLRGSAGVNETMATRAGALVRRIERAARFDESVLNGPNFTNATPFFADARPGCTGPHDYELIDLGRLPANAVPRTVYQKNVLASEFALAVDVDDGARIDEWRVLWRRMVDVDAALPLKAVLVPPGVSHVDTCHTAATGRNVDTVLLAGIADSVVANYLVKILAKGDIRAEVLRRFPAPVELSSGLHRALVTRVLRLNALTEAYAPLWREVARHLTNSCSRPIEPEWSPSSPIRSPRERWRTRVEVDALVGLAYGLDIEDLVAILKSRFVVLSRTEHATRFDELGREVPKEVWRDQGEAGCSAQDGSYVRPFRRPDREAEMRQAYAVFAERYGGGVA